MTEQSEDKSNNDNLNKLTISMTGTPPIITMDDDQRNKNVIKSKNGLMKFLFKIFTENQNLKISKSKFLIYQKIMMILTIF